MCRGGQNDCSTHLDYRVLLQRGVRRAGRRAVGAIGLSWQVALTLLTAVDSTALLGLLKRGDAAHESVRALLTAAAVPSYVEGSVALDLDRDGMVGHEDVARFYGVEEA